MAADGNLQFSSIAVGSRGGLSQGHLRIAPAGLAWKRGSGGRSVEVKKEEIDSLCWTKVSRGCQLGVNRVGASTVNFLGFRDKDLEAIANFCKSSYGLETKEQTMSTSGRNWGSLAIDGSSLTFMVDGRVAFQLPLPDVSQAQQVKDDVVLELHADDTALDDKADALAEVAFHVPPSNTTFAARENGDPPAKVLLDAVLEQTDAGAATASEAVCSFSEVGVVTPRGRFEVEMHLGFFALTGQTQDFKIRYASIMRIFILPKSNSPHTLVVISLDPPIRKGQTYYNHLLCQFPSDDVEEVELDITDEALEEKNKKTGGKLQRSLKGPTFEVFAKVLRGLSGAKITKPGAFKDVAGDGSCVRCSYKADDGHLYPLDRAFFYVPKPPLMVPFEDIESVEFARQGGGVISSSVRTFDLVVRMRNDTEHQFRNIQRTEWQNLFEFIKARNIRIENLASAQQGPGGPGKAVDFGEEMDPGLRRMEAEGFEDSEDDEDFQAGDEEGGSSGGDSEAGGASDAGSGSDVEIVEEEGISVGDVGGGSKKRKGAPSTSTPKEKKEPSAKKPKKEKVEGDEVPVKKGKKAKSGEDGEGEAATAKAKKPRKKKDPNAPKGATSSFMYFSAENRDSVKAENPGIAFGEIGKVLGERWKALTPDEKAPYEEKGRTDKLRFKLAMDEYKKKQAGGGDVDADEAGSEDGIAADDE